MNMTTKNHPTSSLHNECGDYCDSPTPPLLPLQNQYSSMLEQRTKDKHEIGPQNPQRNTRNWAQHPTNKNLTNSLLNTKVTFLSNSKLINDFQQIIIIAPHKRTTQY
jgi:hypothetical protein